jgi:hypothetical protein
MTRRHGPGTKDLPIVIKEAGKAVEQDIKPTLNLLGKLFFNGWPPQQKPEPVKHESETSSARLPPAQQIVITQVGRASEGRAEASETPIIEAEIIEENGIPRICPTCGGAGRLGRRGFEVPCPSCNWPADR